MPMRMSSCALANCDTGGETHRDIAGHFVLKGGKLVLDPISGTLPAGKMSGRLTIDANPPKPPVALVLRAPGLSVRALALMLGLPSDASGSLEVDANLNGAGDSLHAIAAGVERDARAGDGERANRQCLAQPSCSGRS